MSKDKKKDREEKKRKSSSSQQTESPKKHKAELSNSSTPTSSTTPSPPVLGTILVTKNIPDQILVSRKGKRQYIITPSTFLELKVVAAESCEQEEQVNLNNILFSDLSNNSIEDENSFQLFLQTANRNVLIIYFKGENILENGSEEILVDVTPSKNILLKAGTSEYNFANAIAEFIDNSIQAVRNNTPGDRIIKILIGKPNSTTKTTSIRFWDNGCGMSKDHLQRWATMGLSQADLIDNNNNNNSTNNSGSSSNTSNNSSNSNNSTNGDSATGLISRFGVGGKKAAFYLGTEIIVNTKTRGNQWINQAKISLDILNSTGDQEWKIPIIVKEASTADEKNHEQFTEVIINNVSMATDSFETNLEQLKKDLAHIYYYYLHDVGEGSHYTLGDNNSPIKKSSAITSTRKRSSSTTTTTTVLTSPSQKEDDDETPLNEDDDSGDLELDESDESEEESTSTATDKLNASKLNYKHEKKNSYIITLNDQDLSDVNDCIESLYIKYGKKFKIFEFSIPIKETKQSAKVVCHLRYFPFVDEKETMPIPNRILQDIPHMDLKSCPLSLRKPGFEVFWNGRLISEAHIDRLGFMATGKIDGSKIEDKWIQRVKGAIFLNSEFPVTHNKMHIIKESPIFELLDQPAAGGKVAKSSWKKWLLQCHKLDQDIQAKDPKYDSPSNRTYCQGIVIRGLVIHIGDAVSLGSRGVKGIIKHIYHVGRPEYRASDFYCEIDKLHYKQIEYESVLCSKIVKKIPQNEYNTMLQNAKKKLPHKIKLFEGDKATLPKKEYFAGEAIKWVSIALYDSQSPPKEVDRKIIEEENYKIIFTVIYKPTEEVVHRMETGNFYESSRVSFGDIKCFKKTGPYSLVFECSDRKVVKATHFLNVIAGKPSSVKTELEGVQDVLFKTSIDKALPTIKVSLLDEDNNEIEIKQKPENFKIKIIADNQDDDDDEDDDEDYGNGPRDIEMNDIESIGKKSKNKKLNELQLNNDYQVELVEGKIIVSNLIITSAKLNDDSELQFTIQTTFDQFTSNINNNILIPGEPITFTFSDIDGLIDLPTSTSSSSQQKQQQQQIDSIEGYMNLTYLPNFFIFTNDKDGNICRLQSKQISTGVSQLSQSQSNKTRKRTAISTKATMEVGPFYHISLSSPSFDENIYYVSDEVGMFQLCTYNISSLTKKNIRTSPPPTAILLNEKVTKPFESNDNSEMEITSSKTRSKSNRNSNSNKYSLSPITFTLFKDHKELFSVVKNIKILPSYKPQFITLHPLSELLIGENDSFSIPAATEAKFGVKVYSAGGGNRGPFLLNDLVGTLSTSWGAKDQAFEMNGDIIILPDIVTDRMARFSRYTIDIDIPLSKQKDKEFKQLADSREQAISLKKDFSIQTIGGAPTHFTLNLGRGVTSVRCDSEVTLEVGLTDKRHNQVSPDNLKSGIPIEPFFEITNQSNHISQIPCYIKNQSIGEYDYDRNIYSCKVTIIGYGKLQIKVLDKSGQINESSVSLDCIEGRASQLCINGVSKTTIKCAGGQLLDEIIFLVCDTQGTPTKNISGIDTELEWIDLEDRPIPIDIKNRVKITKSEGKLSNLEVKSNIAEGVYTLRVKPKQVDIKEALVSFMVSGKFSIVFLNKNETQKINVSSPPCSFKVQVLNPNNEPIVVPKESMKLLFIKNYPCSEVEEDDHSKPVYVFKNVQLPKKAGKVNLQFIHSLRGSKNTKIQAEETIIIHPDIPSRLSIRGIIKYQPSTSILGKEIGISLTDIYENVIYLPGKIRASIKQSSNYSNTSSTQPGAAIQLPVFNNNKNGEFIEKDFKENDGEATFEELILRSSIGNSGLFNIVFTPFIPSLDTDIEPLEIEFFFQNQQEKLDKQVKLQQQRVSLDSEIQQIEKELTQLKQDQQVSLNEYNTYKVEADDLFNRLTSMIPNLTEEHKGNPETIKRFSLLITKQIEELSSKERRRSPIPSNPISKELYDLSRQDPSSGIIGIIMDLIYIEDDKLARYLSSFLKLKMEGVLFENKYSFEKYYNHYKDRNQPVFFLSHDTILQFRPRRQRNSQNHHLQSNKNQLDFQPVEGAPLTGFIGYVCNILQLKEKHEFLRSTLCFSIFREMMVFQTIRNGLDYKQYVTSKNIQSPPILCMENGEILDATGFVEVGKNPNRNREQSAIFAQLPISESPEYLDLKFKKNCLEDYRTLKSRMHSTKKAFDEKNTYSKIETLTTQRKDKSKQLESIIKEIKAFEQ